VRVREDVCRALTALASVYFRYQSPELALEMREILRENFAAASRCPDRILVISGHAFDNERNSEELAMERASAVMQYYLNLGLASKKVRVGGAIVHQRESWDNEVWRGRRVSTELERPGN
jgi:outer membrane protein OmpA-like peptidoglycan-associated protein